MTHATASVRAHRPAFGDAPLMRSPSILAFAAATALLTAPVAACLVPESTGDFALCCTCLEQRSPQNDGNAVNPSLNCLPDETEVDGCNEQASDQILDPDGAPPIQVTDDLCVGTTCQDECRPATLRGARFEVVEAGLTP